MNNPFLAPGASADELTRVTQCIFDCLDAKAKAHTNTWGYIFALGDHLNIAHDSLVLERKWGRFLKKFGISRTKAFEWGVVARHRKEVEPFVRRAEQTGKPFPLSTALRLTGHGKPPKTSRPKTLTEVETPEVLGPFLDGHLDVFWESLQHAPRLKSDIDRRSKALIESATQKAVAEIQAIHALLTNLTRPNVETVREKLALVAHLLDPTLKPSPAAPRPFQLDRSALPKALTLGQDDLELPDSLQRTPVPVH